MINLIFTVFSSPKNYQRLFLSKKISSMYIKERICFSKFSLFLVGFVLIEKMWWKILAIVLLIFYVRADYSPYFSELDSEVIVPLRPTDPEGLSFRLANNTRPVHYDIFLSTAVHEADFRFNGTVNIRFRTLVGSNNIVLNFKQIDIHQADLLTVNGILIQNNLPIIGNVVTELVTFNFPNQIAAGQEFVVRVVYSGVLRTDSYGFYRGSYIDENGQVKWYATTQFQATDARHAFPW